MTLPLDPANDPDRYDPTRETKPTEGPLDWALDPDRYDPDRDDPPVVERPALVLGRTGGRRSTLPELIGKEASFQDSPSPYIWVLGLVGIAAFLLLFAFVFSHLSP
ncbi:MAG: hypothetical protein QOJ79_2265 [Actinomycetota bacterium]|jgi:hypothetical protein|nr:hypothetical protein [Actinomycetota bacterium]